MWLLVAIVMAVAVGDDLNRMCYAGLVGMWDPPRENVMSSIETLLAGNVDVKMITGDSLDTAKAIGTCTCVTMRSIATGCSWFMLLQYSVILNVVAILMHS